MSVPQICDLFNDKSICDIHVHDKHTHNCTRTNMLFSWKHLVSLTQRDWVIRIFGEVPSHLPKFRMQWFMIVMYSESMSNSVSQCFPKASHSIHEHWVYNILNPELLFIFQLCTTYFWCFELYSNTTRAGSTSCRCQINTKCKLLSDDYITYFILHSLIFNQ